MLLHACTVQCCCWCWYGGFFYKYFQLKINQSILKQLFKFIYCSCSFDCVSRFSHRKLLNVTTDGTDSIVFIVKQKQKNSTLMKGIVVLLCRQYIERKNIYVVCTVSYFHSSLVPSNDHSNSTNNENKRFIICNSKNICIHMLYPSRKVSCICHLITFGWLFCGKFIDGVFPLDPFIYLFIYNGTENWSENRRHTRKVID